MELIETPVFTRLVDQELPAGTYRLLQLHLVQHPDAGAIIPGSGGLRKLRWRLPGRGKRGGARVIYYWQPDADRLFLLFLYPKNVQGDLTTRQIRTLRALVAAEASDA